MRGSENHVEFLKPHLSRVRKQMNAFCESSDPGIREIITPYFSVHGKMLRPSLLILASMFGNGPDDKIYELAAAIEIFHIATLIHDDILDDAGTRRNIRSAHTSWGTKKAVLAGDYLLAKALGTASEFEDRDGLRQAAAGIAHICRSEIDQSLHRYSYECSMRRYIRRISGKTAALFAAAARTGAGQSGCTPLQIQHLSRAGYNLGLCFQIIDDLLDFKNATGKKKLADLKNGIISLPVLLALQEHPELAGKLPAGKMAFGQRKAAKAAAFIINKTEAIKRCGDYIKKYSDRATKEINALEASKAREMLVGFFGSLLTRNS